MPPSLPYDIPRTNIAHLPTPIEPLPRLSQLLGGPELWIKRDDQTGLATGGNKTRKLEFFIADAMKDGCEMVLTRGAGQSNHCRQTAAAAARTGLKCKLILSGSPPPDASGNFLLDLLFGAQITWTEGEDPDKVLERELQAARNDGLKPYLIPYGGSNEVGVYAYVSAMDELASQGNEFNRIVFASSSGGTQAGMVLGAQLTGFRGEIVGISVDEHASVLRRRILDLITRTASWLGTDVEVEESHILVEDGFIGGGYAVLSDLERDAIKTFAQAEGILLDPVYTGRAAGGMIELIRTGKISPDERVLFWHTGGIPAIFSYGEDLL